TAMECIKNCCKTLMKKKGQEQETPGQKLAEDYLLSKLPPDGREVPFVIPSFKASYIQPSYPNLQAEPQSMYLSCSEAQMVTPHPAVCVFLNVTDSITLSGDERELGKVCIQLNYQEALEQVWITLVQVRLHTVWRGGDSGTKSPIIGFKAIITTPKPIQFKSSIKEYCQDVSFMETFVFALRLQQLRCSALVLRLQSHNPRKRTVAECVLSLRHLGSQEAEHWLELNPPSKSSVCHSELHLSTCFQPVNGRIQVQVLAAQNLPASSSPLTQSFFVKVEMHQMGQVVMKKKTRALKVSGGQCQWTETFHFLLTTLDHVYSLSVKLYSRSSVRRKQCLGQVSLSDIPVPEAVEQWKDTMAHPEKVVAAWHRLSSS
uniref:Tandem C2 domains, nuclear n=1 Tax=Amphilophus citrinellus TaxID=61819 RepID=A0A3Q0SJ39_AMPCI